jgi:peptidylprolyl isomerase
MRTVLLSAYVALAFGVPLAAQDVPREAPAPSEIITAAPKADWVAIAAEDLLVMTLAPDAEGKPRQVVIQLMPAPFSQGWVHNVRLLARSRWYDGISVNRVQDNYVTQWGDPNYDNPEAKGKPKPLPDGLKVMGEADYVVQLAQDQQLIERMGASIRYSGRELNGIEKATGTYGLDHDVYGEYAGIRDGWPVALVTPDSPDDTYKLWPTHCYGMVGVGRNYSPDTGSGAELYTVIGHAPRHLDRNIALVGRVIEGMEHLSSLPRGSGALGFYTAGESAKRTPITSIRVANDLPTNAQPRFEYLSTTSATFATYAEAIANRRDPFFIVPAGGADICNIRVPVRPVVP